MEAFNSLAASLSLGARLLGRVWSPLPLLALPLTLGAEKQVKQPAMAAGAQARVCPHSLASWALPKKLPETTPPDTEVLRLGSDPGRATSAKAEGAAEGPWERGPLPL